MYKNNNRARGRLQEKNPSAALNSLPRAIASFKGAEGYTDISGDVRFFDTESGVFVIVEVDFLPSGPSVCEGGIFAIHIHEGGDCGGVAFENAGAHFSPLPATHPNHAGDMPPLFCNDGYAFSAFVTNRFTIDEIIGRTVVIHAMRDDFTSQPAGNSGERIACGVISAVRR